MKCRKQHRRFCFERGIDKQVVFIASFASITPASPLGFSTLTAVRLARRERLSYSVGPNAEIWQEISLTTGKTAVVGIHVSLSLMRDRAATTISDFN